jgi:DNA-binding NarL/FixJ family response regulator
MPTMRVVLCDEHVMFREAFETLLGRRGYDVVATLAHPHDLVDVARNQGDEFVDVIVTELHFPELSGTSVVSFVRGCCPGVPIVVLTAATDVALLRSALDVGANGIALKTDGVDEVLNLLGFIRGPLAARMHPSPGKLWSKRARALLDRGRSRSFEEPTARELDVIELLTLGKSTKEMAKELHVSMATVRTHLQHIFIKLDVHSRTELMAYAVRQGLLEGRLQRAGIAG